MKYAPKSEETLAKEGLFPNGIYDAEIAEATERVSKSGNDMIQLKLNVFDDQGSMRSVFDYIVPSSNFGERKLRHAADAFGLVDEYESGKLKGEDFSNKSGKVEIGQSKPTDDYPMPKNIVTDYIGRGEATVMQEQKKSVKQELDDGIPF